MGNAPHARGGEPVLELASHVNAHMLPTHVGVNRLHSSEGPRAYYAPHARGGEPALGMEAVRLDTCPPRTWG